MTEYSVILLKVFGAMKEDAVILLLAFGTAVCANLILMHIVGPWIDRRAGEKRKEPTCILIDPTRRWFGSALEIKIKKGKKRYYRNGWRISEETYDREFRVILERISERASKEDASSGVVK